MLINTYGLGSREKNTESYFYSAVVQSREFILKENNFVKVNELKLWEEDCNEEFDFYVVNSFESSIFKNTFTYQGLVSEFSKIQDKEGVEEFAAKYGLLGLETLENIHFRGTKYDYGHLFITLEPLKLWLEEAETVRKTLKLYHTLKKCRNNPDFIVDESLFTFRKSDLHDDLYLVFWDGIGHKNDYSSEELDKMSTEKLLREILINSISFYIDQFVNVEAKIVESSKKSLGFYVTEIPNTHYLLTAIYYDLWKALGENVNVELCMNPECNLPFIKNKRQEYCSNSCKQQAYRLRKQQS